MKQCTAINIQVQVQGGGAGLVWNIIQKEKDQNLEIIENLENIQKDINSNYYLFSKYYMI